MKKEKPFDARRLDIRRFAEEEAPLTGQGTVGDFPRLMSETAGRGAGAPVQWRAQGELRNAGHVQPQAWVQLEADTTLPLICQRCLSEVDVKISVQRLFRFVADEATAASEDDEAEEDVLVESRSFDLLELVEDELLMGVPVAPRHVVCPVLPQFSAGDDEFNAAQGERQNPFAVLQSLKPKR